MGLCAAIALILGLANHNVAHAAELKVLTSVALTSVLDELAPMFEKASGTSLSIDYNLIAAQRKRILEGETADVIILSRGVMDELQKQDRIFANGLVNVAGTPLSVAARAGAPKPDISTDEKFKQALLNADPNETAALTGAALQHQASKVAADNAKSTLARGHELVGSTATGVDAGAESTGEPVAETDQAPGEPVNVPVTDGNAENLF